MMLAMVFQGEGVRPQRMRVPRPSIKDPTDVIVNVSRTTIVRRHLSV